MNVLVIGAAGRTGKAVVAQAVAAGHQVTAFVHQAGDDAAPNVRIIVGDATDGAAVAAAVAGQDAVLDTIGGKTPYQATTLEASVASVVVAAMRQHGVRRLVVVSMLGEGESTANAPFYGRLLMATFLRGDSKDKAAMEAAVTGSDLDWVILPPPFSPMTPPRATCGCLKPPRARRPTKSPGPTWPSSWSPSWPTTRICTKPLPSPTAKRRACRRESGGVRPDFSLRWFFLPSCNALQKQHA